MTFFSHHQIEDNLEYHQLTAVVTATASTTVADNHNNRHGKKKKKVSYVTSFWAKKQSPHNNSNNNTPLFKIIPHRKEIEAALLANIYNPYIDQVVVFLDKNDDEEEEEELSCVHFYQDMEELNRQFIEKRTLLSSTNTNNNNYYPNTNTLIGGGEVMDFLSKKVTCVNLSVGGGGGGGQPTYYQMFQNTLSDEVTGDIIILANADMVFDDTLSKVRTLKEDVLVVLGTRGFSEDMPSVIREFYDTIVGGEETYSSGGSGGSNKDWDVNQCKKNPWSWDTWIFHKQTLQGKLLQDTYFQRPTKYRNHEMAPFYMNENGAENAALWALEQSYHFAAVYNACDIIASWSFHLTPRIHHKQGQSRWGTEKNHKAYIPKPWGGSKVRPKFNGVRMDSPPYPPKWCESLNGCFVDG